MKPGTKYQPNKVINFGVGNDIHWIVVNGLLIANRSLQGHPSWDDLNQQNLVFGKEVSVNGQQFISRLLKVGVQDGDTNEWDAALDATSEDDNLWHWEMVFFWGQESISSSDYINRGYYSARCLAWNSSSLRLSRLGFRPALELLPSSNLVAGDRICAIGGQSILYGELLEVSSYDAIIIPDSASMMVESDAGKLFSKLEDGTIAIDQHMMTIQSISRSTLSVSS